jgi:hypothetical protein
MLEKRDNPRIRHLPEGGVRVLIDLTIPATGQPKQTLAGRRRLLRNSLVAKMTAVGWIEVGVWVFRHNSPVTADDADAAGGPY